MPVPTTIADLSTTAGSNYPAGTDSPSTLDDVQRAHASFIAQLRDGANINTATGKTTPVDADELPLADSAASFVLKKLTWANLKATLATWINGGTIPGSFTTLASTGDYSSPQNQSIYSYNGGVIGSVRAGVQLVGSTQQVRAYTAGTLRSVIDSTGASSFGDLTSPSTWSTGKTIELGYAGNGLFANGASSMSVIANAYYNAGWKYASADYATRFQCVSGVYSWQITPSAGAAPGDAATMTTKMSLDNTGLSVTGTISPQQATTAGAPAYVKGALYFDTTLNKLRVGGATAWETVTSS